MTKKQSIIPQDPLSFFEAEPSHNYVWPQDSGTPYFQEIAMRFIEIHENKCRGAAGMFNLPNRNLTLVEFELVDPQNGQAEKHLLLLISGRTYFELPLIPAEIPFVERQKLREKHKKEKKGFGYMQQENKVFKEQTIPAFFKELKLPSEIKNVHILLDYNKATEAFFKMNGNLDDYWACSEPKGAVELGRFALLARAMGKIFRIGCSENVSLNCSEVPSFLSL